MLIDRFVKFLLPKQDHFFVLLEGIATKIDEAAGVFSQLETARSHSQLQKVAELIKPIETDADELGHELYKQLDKTFVTPIDREDLAILVKVLDDVVDGMEHSATFAALYQFDQLTDPMKNLVRITVSAAKELADATRLLRNFNKPEVVHDASVSIHTLENEADSIYRRAVAALFQDGVSPIELVRQKDLLFALEEGVDTCEDAMDQIRSVVMKNA